MKKFFTALLATTILFTCTYCAEPKNTYKSGKDKPNSRTYNPEDYVDESNGYTDFATELFKAYYKSGGDTLCPFTVYRTIAMLSFGAGDATKQEIIDLLGCSSEKLNEFSEFFKFQPKEAQVNFADSVWYNSERQAPYDDFVNSVKQGAEYKALKFNKSTQNKINDWVKKNTDGIIKDFINEPEIEDVRMFIVSTAAVEAKWRYPYAGSVSGSFCSESGKTTKVEMMTSVEKCFTLPGAKGIKKEYEGNLCFAAILPDGGLDSFVESLDAEKLKDALKTSSGDITAIIPKFKKESKANLTEVLKEAGFTLDGDFSRIAPDSGETFVSKAISAVSIENDEFGTKAFAASEITVKESAAMETITFNRPFLYLVYDTETLMPLFIGAVKEI